MALDIFERLFGEETLPVLDDDSRPRIALGLLNAIQTVVNVIADDVNKGYAVTYSPTPSAFTEHGKRLISLSGKPLFGSPVGTPLRDIAAVMTGFAVHEVGHTKRIGIIDAVRAEWPGKVLPKTLGNIIEDVVLEERTVERYAGFRDVFAPTLEWVAEATCPKHALVWEGSTGHKVNIVGQIVRYRPFVTFSDDAVTQAELRWWDEWTARIVFDLTPEGGVQMVRDALDHLASQREDVPDDDGGCEFPLPKGPDGGLPDEEDDDKPKREPKPGKGEGEPTDEDGDTEGEDGDGDDSDGGDTEGDDDGDGDGEDGDTEGGSEGDGDSEPDDDTEGGNPGGDDDGEGDTEGEPEGEPEGGEDPGEGKGETVTDGDEIDTADRPILDAGTNDTEGGGGSGEGISEATPEDDVDAGLDETELSESFDDLSHSDNGYRDQRLDTEVEVERTTTRVDAGAHGKMKIVWE
jgi:hypothetical protein